MNVNAATSSPTDSSSTTGLTGETGDMFLKLLTTQLKSQDPLSPMDPNQFVGQLVQFNTLGEIMRIRELLDPASTQTSATTNDGSGGH
jgi:flagellar basal-body rod modification protein FlgD